MKILVLSDSLTLPRDAGDDQTLDHADTWPQVLNRKHPEWEIVSTGIGSATSEDILYQTRYWTGFDADHVIIQVGLCDALPRALHAWEVELVKKLPPMWFWRGFVNKISVPLRRHRGITLLSERVFRTNLERIAETLKHTSFLPILDNGLSPSHIPNAHRNVFRYSEILKETVGSSFIDLGEVPGSAFMPDHYHLNATGHQLVSKAVEKHVMHFNC